jgi:glutamine amidotransferase
VAYFVVVDYCKGNLRSMQKGLQLAGAEARVSADPAVIARAGAIVLPGVGAFADAAGFMQTSGQMEVIRERIAEGVPFLGVCLGLQLLMERGNEGVPSPDWMEGLGVVSGCVRRVDAADERGRFYKVPHVGWNQVHCKDETDARLAPLFAGIDDGSNFYFTHSYRAEVTDQQDILATVTHARSFPCVIRKMNAFGVQFHPEKSSHKGLRVLQNFAAFARSL